LAAEADAKIKAVFSTNTALDRIVSLPLVWNQRWQGQCPGDQPTLYHFTVRAYNEFQFPETRDCPLLVTLFVVLW
jgi:hypothetical protein